MSDLGFEFWGAIAGVCLIGVATLALILIERRRMIVMARLHRLADPTARHQPRPLGDAGSFSSGVMAWIHRLAQITVERFSIMGGGEAEKSADLLVTAGFRGRDALVVFTFIKTILPLVAVAVGLVWYVFLAPADVPMISGVIVVAGSGLVFSKAPDMVLSHLRSKRLYSLRRSFPDMLELLVITSEAGLGPQKAMSRVAWEMRISQPILSAELSQMVTELSMTGDRVAAYQNLSARVPLPEFSIFTQTLSQSEKYGTPFATAIRTLIRDQRADRLLRVEEKAARLPALMTVPLIFFIMPAIFVVLVGPAVLTIIDNIIGAF